MGNGCINCGAATGGINEQGKCASCSGEIARAIVAATNGVPLDRVHVISDSVPVHVAPRLWCRYFDAWRIFTSAGIVYLEPPTGVITASDFEALLRSGVQSAQAVHRPTPKVGVYLAFTPTAAWSRALAERGDDGRMISRPA